MPISSYRGKNKLKIKKKAFSWPLPFLVFSYFPERKQASLAAMRHLTKRTKYIDCHKSPSKSIYANRILHCINTV